MIKTPHWPIPLGKKPIDFGLIRVKASLERLGNPHQKLPPVVHIAGTNGKGSTLAFLKAILEAAGLRVHRYTSPHLIYFNERIELCGKPIDDDYLYDCLERCRNAADRIPLTYFEGTTVAALLAFAETPADIVLLETGMGGRLDATNVIDKPLATILTPISFDHMDYLGDTIAKIAAEKAPIMRQKVPCIVAPQLHEGMEIIEIYARSINTILYSNEVALPCLPTMAGEHQITNAKTAVATIPHLKGFTITNKHIIEGLKNAHWPARLQKLTLYNKEVWLDGGHNAEGGKVLSSWAKNQPPLTLIVGMLKNKDLRAFLTPLKPYISELIAIPIPETPDCFTPEEIQKIAIEMNIPAANAENAKEALSRATNNEQRATLIAGSLYLAGSVLAECE